MNARVLIGSGYSVDTAADGADAWAAVQTVSYDLLITDNSMPRVSGLELIRKLRSENMTLPVILASGTVPIEELKRHPLLPLEAILPKPFTIAELLDVVKKVLREAGSVATSAQLFRDCAMMDDQIPQAVTSANTPVRHKNNRPCRILVVDDDQDGRQLSVDVLIGSGYGAEGVKDGAAGWKALQANNYDLVVTDNKMPKMTGIEMIAKLRLARMAVPVIMATGVLPMDEFAGKPWLKPDALLQRPYSNDDLLETVKAVLHWDDGNDRGKETLPKNVPVNKS